MADGNDLIAAIYDAIIDPSRWEEVVKHIVEATGSVSGTLIILQANGAHLSAKHNLDPYYEKAYVEHWHKQNPLLALEATTNPGDLRTCTCITKTDTFRASPIFQ